MSDKKWHFQWFAMGQFLSEGTNLSVFHSLAILGYFKKLIQLFKNLLKMDILWHI